MHVLRHAAARLRGVLGPLQAASRGRMLSAMLASLRAIVARGAAVAAVALSATACSSVGGSAVRTGPVALPPHWGEVAIYAASVPERATELGVVEVHASQAEANVETLLPLFVQKVAGLGGDAAVIDHVEGSFLFVPHPTTETFSYACGFRAVCIGSRTVYSTDEWFVLSIRGRAMHRAGAR